MVRQRRLLAVVFAAFAVATGAGAPLAAQPFRPEPSPLFDGAALPSVYIDVAPGDLAAILIDVDSDVEYPARFVYDDGAVRDTVEAVGFRLRGNTSRDAGKKSFKVSFNTFETGRKYRGFEKLNLNGEHNDPTVARAKLAWDLFGQTAVPASRAAHVRLYVNGTYYGLYVNVEHVDEQFLQSRFGDDGGNLYKCLWPAALTVRGAGRAADYLPDANGRPYELAQHRGGDEPFADLAHFIAVLNETPDEAFAETVEQIFDVNGFLRVLATDVVVGGWDDYWYLMNNFYLYHNPATDRWHYIPYDYDNTFGVDFVQEDWARRDVYAWGHPREARPLATRILNVPEYRDRFTFYLRRLLEGPAAPAVLLPRIDSLHQALAASVEDDPYYPASYGWDAADFHRSFTEALGGHVEHGLAPFVETRTSTALAQLDDVDVAPILSGLRVSPPRPDAGQPIRLVVLVEDEGVPAAVEVHYRAGEGPVQMLPLYDDGAHDDYAAGDGYYGGTLPLAAAPTVLHLDVAATDAAGQVGRAPAVAVAVGGAGAALYVNELMASNSITIRDEAGQADDWIELYNASDAAVALDGYTLTDNFDDPDRWAFPAGITIPARGFLVVWADGDADQGPLHASFSLDRDGEQVGLYDPTGAPVSTFSFDRQETDVSFGRAQDGAADLAVLPRPTPGTSNDGAGTATDEQPEAVPALAVRAYPNPFGGQATVRFELPGPGRVVLEVWDAAGRRVRRLVEGTFPAGPHEAVWDGRGDAGQRLAAGLYFVRLAVAETSSAGRAVAAPVVFVR